MSTLSWRMLGLGIVGEWGASGVPLDSTVEKGESFGVRPSQSGCAKGGRGKFSRYKFRLYRNRINLNMRSASV